MPERQVTFQDWQRWKHRVVSAVIFLYATTAVAVTVAFVAFTAAGRASDKVIEAKAETAAIKADFNSSLAAGNRFLIQLLCTKDNDLIIGMRSYIEGFTTPENHDQVLSEFDKTITTEDCTAFVDTASTATPPQDTDE